MNRYFEFIALVAALAVGGILGVSLTLALAERCL